MSSILNTSESLRLQTNLQQAAEAVESATKKLSTGLTYERVDEEITARSMAARTRKDMLLSEVGLENVYTSINTIQIADVGMEMMVDLLLDQRVIAMQSCSDTASAADRAGYDIEFQTKVSMLDNLARGLNFNGVTFFDGSFSSDANMETANGSYYEFNITDINEYRVTNSIAENPFFATNSKPEVVARGSLFSSNVTQSLAITNLSSVVDTNTISLNGIELIKFETTPSGGNTSISTTVDDLLLVDDTTLSTYIADMQNTINSVIENTAALDGISARIVWDGLDVDGEYTASNFSLVVTSASIHDDCTTSNTNITVTDTAGTSDVTSIPQATNNQIIFDQSLNGKIDNITASFYADDHISVDGTHIAQVNSLTFSFELDGAMYSSEKLALSESTTQKSFNGMGNFLYGGTEVLFKNKSISNSNDAVMLSMIIQSEGVLINGNDASGMSSSVQDMNEQLNIALAKSDISILIDAPSTKYPDYNLNEISQFTESGNINNTGVVALADDMRILDTFISDTGVVAFMTFSTDTVLADGDVVTVGGASFVAGIDFELGADPTTQRDNILKALQNSSNVLVTAASYKKDDTTMNAASIKVEILSERENALAGFTLGCSNASVLVNGSVATIPTQISETFSAMVPEAPATEAIIEVSSITIGTDKAETDFSTALGDGSSATNFIVLEIGGVTVAGYAVATTGDTDATDATTLFGANNAFEIVSTPGTTTNEAIATAIADGITSLTATGKALEGIVTSATTLDVANPNKIEITSAVEGSAGKLNIVAGDNDGIDGSLITITIDTAGDDAQPAKPAHTETSTFVGPTRVYTTQFNHELIGDITSVNADFIEGNISTQTENEIALSMLIGDSSLLFTGSIKLQGYNDFGGSDQYNNAGAFIRSGTDIYLTSQDKTVTFVLTTVADIDLTSSSLNEMQDKVISFANDLQATLSQFGFAQTRNIIGLNDAEAYNSVLKGINANNITITSNHFDDLNNGNAGQLGKFTVDVANDAIYVNINGKVCTLDLLSGCPSTTDPTQTNYYYDPRNKVIAGGADTTLIFKSETSCGVDDEIILSINLRNVCCDIDISTAENAQYLEDALNNLFNSADSGGMQFLIGPDIERDLMVIDFPTLTADHLYLDENGLYQQTINVLTKSAAGEAITILDLAIERILSSQIALRSSSTQCSNQEKILQEKIAAMGDVINTLVALDMDVAVQSLAALKVTLQASVTATIQFLTTRAETTQRLLQQAL